ncbi:MAG: hypothetical protein RSC49_01050 [Clostridium sp.]
MKLYNLFKLFPYYYQANDTYKDDAGKGILERFLEICGTYFQDNITPDIDNILKIIDIDKTDDIYLNYIWEFLGSMPYAYGSIQNAGIWELYSDTKLNRNTWISSSKDIPRARYRDILKYAISLYKIRGTLGFYNILLGFYDMSCTISDSSGDLDNPQGSNVKPITAPPLYDSGIRFDTEKLVYDEMLDCFGCSEVNLVVDLSKLPVAPTTLDKDRILLLLNRFRPLNVVVFSNSNVTFTDAKVP